MSETCLLCSRGGLDPETAVALSNGYRHQICERLEGGDYWPFEHHVLPNGEVFYRDSTHDYFTEVKPVTQGRGEGKGIVGYTGVAAARVSSPSAIAKYADPDLESLIGFVVRVMRHDLKDEEVALLAAAPELGVDTTQPANDILRDCKGAVGNIAHAAAESIFEGEPIGDVHPVAQGYVDGVVAFIADLGNFEILQREQVIYSAKHGYAGRFDARIQVPIQGHAQEGQPKPYETWLLDFKTSSFIGRAYHNQLAGYDLAAEECGVGASDRSLIVQVRADGTYTPWPCRGTREGFLLNLASYNDGKRMDAETKADWRELVAA